MRKMFDEDMLPGEVRAMIKRLHKKDSFNYMMAGILAALIIIAVAAVIIVKLQSRRDYDDYDFDDDCDDGCGCGDEEEEDFAD